MRKLIILLILFFSVPTTMAATYAVTGGGGDDSRSLFSLNPDTGALTLIGEVGFRMTGLGFTSDGRLWAVTPAINDDQCDDATWECFIPALLLLDPSDGSVLDSRPIELAEDAGWEYEQIQDLAIDPYTDRMFVVGYHGVFGELDTTDGGVVTLLEVGDLREQDTASCGAAAFDGGGSLYCTDWCWGSLEGDVGALHQLSTADGSILSSTPTTNSLIGMGRVGDVMLGSVYKGGCGGFGPGSRGDIVSVNLDTGEQTLILSGDGIPYVHDIASDGFAISKAVPTLPLFGLVALCGLLGVAGMRRLRFVQKKQSG